MKTLIVDSPIKVALFDLCIRPELKEGGRWGTKSQTRLASEWVDVEVRVAKEDEPLGRNFPAQKTNWNVNDSNWVNPEKNFKKLMKTAVAANGGVSIHKKVLVAHLEDLKKTFALEVPFVEEEKIVEEVAA